jgi:hypothetical protein
MIDETILEERLARLESAKAWSPRVVSRLETLIRTGPDEAVFRINPIRFAAERGMLENEAIDLFLHATLAGIVDMDWLLYCRCAPTLSRTSAPCGRSTTTTTVTSATATTRPHWTIISP